MGIASLHLDINSQNPSALELVRLNILLLH
jgi:hypothetical protein